MTTWTKDQVRQVSGLRAEAMVALEVIARARLDVLTVTRRQLVARLIDMAHAFVTEPHPGDFQFSEVEDDNLPALRIRCWWEPPTKVIELRGGERDGEVLEFMDAPWGALRMALAQPPQWLTEADDDGPTPVDLRVQTYEMTAWLEDERRWVYTATGRP